MSNLSPDFTLPINFCANPQDAWTIPVSYTHLTLPTILLV